MGLAIGLLAGIMLQVAPGHAVGVGQDIFAQQRVKASIKSGAGTVDASYRPGVMSDASVSSDPTYPGYSLYSSGGPDEFGCITLKVGTTTDNGCGSLTVTVDQAMQTGKVTGSVPSFRYGGSYHLTVNITVTLTQTTPPTAYGDPMQLTENCDPPTYGCPGGAFGLSRVGSVTGGSISSTKIGSTGSSSGTGSISYGLGVFASEYNY